MLAEFTQWLLGLVKELFASLWSFITDAFIALVDLLVGALVGLASLIPVPSFMQGGLAQLFGSLDSPILYVVTAAGIPQALAIIGAGYGFRLARKVATLFQW